MIDLELLDLVLHVVIGIVDFCPDTGFFQKIGNLFSILIMLGADRNDTHLIRRQPEGEISLEVFDDNTDETLDRSVDTAVDNYGYLFVSVRSYLGKA